MSAVPRPFNSEHILEQRIGNGTLRAYHVGFDQNKFRLQPLANVIAEVIPEFALGLHTGASVPLTLMRSRLREAARRVYTTDKYKARGEFGELILHLLLRDFCGSVPLVSKIYFKDSENVPAHGFDGVHVVTTESEKQLWLGESKLYTDGFNGVRELADDLKKHTQSDYLRSEFALISPKIPVDFPEARHWRQLLHENQRLDAILDSVWLPMVCTYSSNLFGKHVDDTAAYTADFIKECKALETAFAKARISTSINVILMLLPIESKQALVTELDTRLKRMQNI